jgi:hypothetical protein
MFAVVAIAMDLDSLICRIRNEFLEMPGLRLSIPQAMRLWGVDEDACRQVVDALVRSAFLQRTSKGEVVRLD